MNYKTFFTALLLVALFSSPAVAQDTFFQDADPQTEAKAKELTQKYQPELVMTGEQTLLFEKKVTEFLLRRQDIKRMNITTEDKLFLLADLAEQEANEMGTILTRRQLRQYLKVQPVLQPVQVTVKK
ncbi:hypothetical protein [Pareuzebyella sediminis]|uniref:hypothetical protein n=1 Tax=Pareuzebyella sediminis TaxID=2607998 RepID=UPI0011EE18E8|nr:hypothetical protein [Pareuzebyella sediminis]